MLSTLRRAAGAGRMFATPRRFLNVHEYVSMSLMAEYNVPVPRSAVATTAEEAEQAFTSKLSGGGELRRLVVMFRRACAGLQPRALLVALTSLYIEHMCACISGTTTPLPPLRVAGGWP
jgi:hypothetical protein